ncbi:MAG: Arc family DNA-binding protein, partial [Oscillospiraceae bacterium]|nr:Arc family DNA-binding protein [Oscillospiraceae bacterium]
MPSDKARYTIRLPDDVHYKIKYIADDNFRPINSELMMLVLKRIAEYEAEHGEIK